MHAIIWEYAIKPERRGEFERAYAADGPWVELFSQSPGFIRTMLLTAPHGRYVTIDFWTDADSFDAFMRDFAAEYNAMDAAFAGMTLEETKIGRFNDASE